MQGSSLGTNGQDEVSLFFKFYINNTCLVILYFQNDFGSVQIVLNRFKIGFQFGPGLKMYFHYWIFLFEPCQNWKSILELSKKSLDGSKIVLDVYLGQGTNRLIMYCLYIFFGEQYKVFFGSPFIWLHTVN